jgi:hypothetical protein
MIRNPSPAVLLLALSACTTPGEKTSRGATPGPETQRITHTIPVVDGVHSGVMMIGTRANGTVAPIQIDASPDSVYAALAAAYEEAGIAVGTSDPQSRTVGNTRVRAFRSLGRTPVSEYVSCGYSGAGSASADANPVRLSVLTTVTPAGRGSQLFTVVEAAYVSAESGGSSPCGTTGSLEAKIGRAVQLKLGGR